MFRKKLPRLTRLLLGIGGVLILLGGGCLVTLIRNENAMESTYTVIRSPNLDRRPLFQPITCVVLHATATETTEQTVQIFQERRTRVSAHFVVGRDGKIIQMVPLGRRAWHAGVSKLGNQVNVNNFSVGIELVNRNDGQQPFTPRQYQAVAAIIRHLQRVRHYPIPTNRIVSHREIALPHGRKSDPRGFDFQRLKRMID